MHRAWIRVLIGLLATLSGWPGYASAAPDLVGDLRRAGLRDEQIVIPFQLSPEIRAWEHRTLETGGNLGSVMEYLLLELQDPEGKTLHYERGYTGSAAEVFASGRFNCLGFANLFVGLAREIGLDAYFVRIEQIERFGVDGSYVVVSSHVTAAYGPPMNRIILEFGFENESLYRTAMPISDREAVALYYSNRGTELLRDGRPRAAAELLRAAVGVGPEVPDGWLNLGVVLRRLGKLSEAERAYRRALDLDPELLPAYYNLSVLFRVRGDPDAVERMIELVDRRSNRNPFTYVSLGDMSMRHGEVKEAFHFYDRALELDHRKSVVQAAMGMWALEVGDLEEARRRLRLARKYDGESERTTELASRLASLEAATAGDA